VHHSAPAAITTSVHLGNTNGSKTCSAETLLLHGQLSGEGSLIDRRLNPHRSPVFDLHVPCPASARLQIANSDHCRVWAEFLPARAGCIGETHSAFPHIRRACRGRYLFYNALICGLAYYGANGAGLVVVVRCNMSGTSAYALLVTMPLSDKQSRYAHVLCLCIDAHIPNPAE